jgi:adenylate cyclase
LFHFKSFRGRILSFFLGLIIIIQISSLFFIDYANTQNARELVGEALNVTSQSFNNQIISRNNGLTQAGRLLSGDFAFKTAYASGSTATFTTALDNHRQRIGANLMFLLSIEGMLVTSSGSNTASFKTADGMFFFPGFIDNAIKDGAASGLVSIDNNIYSLIAVPLLTPVPTAWIVLGFEIDDALIRQLQLESHAHVSLLTNIEHIWNVGISTLSSNEQELLTEILKMDTTKIGETFDITLGDETYFTFIKELPSAGDLSIFAVLKRNSSEALAPYNRIRNILIILLIMALIISFVAGGVIASSVTRPVRSLVQLAGQIQKGEYQNKIEINQRDELGHLADAFNDMSKGLFERDKVRNLLGKVISPEIAEELINKDVKLGGEEKEITILFTDL